MAAIGPLRRFSPSPGFILLLILLAALWLGGGASQPATLGQAVVRGVAWTCLGTAIILCDRPAIRPIWPIWALTIAALALPLVQLIPLPPGTWAALPGRTFLLEAANASGQPQGWRPWSIVPSATLNAASSLIVPITTLLLVASLRAKERLLLPGVLLSLIAASALLGLMQSAGTSFDNPLINESPGQVSGNFANRNHFALFLALGCLVVPTWLFSADRNPAWRTPVGLGLIVLFLLTILASGSRAGLSLGILALTIGLASSWRSMRRLVRHYPRWVFPALIGALVGVVLIFGIASVMSDRALSINRLFGTDPGQDMRRRGLPVVVKMIAIYFPFGTGLGSFDPMFRIYEPFALLKLTYFNHAHNDYLEVVLDSGLAGSLLLLAALGWWLRASVRAWRTGNASYNALPRLGSATLLLVIVACVFDYPARTPLFMAVVIIAAAWLQSAGHGRHASALPRVRQHL